MTNIKHLSELLERAGPLLECKHKANAPREDGSRLVGFVTSCEAFDPYPLLLPIDALGALQGVAALAPQLAADVVKLTDLVEAAYREGWREGYATGDGGGSYNPENDWLGSEALSSIGGGEG